VVEILVKSWEEANRQTTGPEPQRVY
jgi:hypothetical protein